ncbi:hypothetical protein Tco_0568662, partial [Tanacetum coccineum]
QEDATAPNNWNYDDVIVIPSDEEADEKRVSVIGRKCVYALIDESDNDKELTFVIDMSNTYLLTDFRFNLAFFIAERMEFVTKPARLILPYGMLLTRLFKYLMSESPELFNESYVLYDRVMYPLTAQQERKTRKDYGTKRGRHSTSSSSAFDHLSSSHLNDDGDDENDDGTSRASTHSLTQFVNSLTNEVPRIFENPPNIDTNIEPFYTHQTKILNSQAQLRDEQRGGLRSIGKGIKN